MTKNDKNTIMIILLRKKTKYVNLNHTCVLKSLLERVANSRRQYRLTALPLLLGVYIIALKYVCKGVGCNTQITPHIHTHTTHTHTQHTTPPPHNYTPPHNAHNHTPTQTPHTQTHTTQTHTHTYTHTPHHINKHTTPTPT
jgi:hypothetical protein